MAARVQLRDITNVETAALALVDVGLAVIFTDESCKPGTIRKLEPVADGEKKALAAYDGMKDPVRIRNYCRRYPRANLSVATGDPSGVFVLDVDDKDGFSGSGDLRRLEERFGDLPLTWQSRTPSGGVHLWFRQPRRAIMNRVHFKIPDGNGGLVKSGLDVRCMGAAAAAPPSRKPHGAYVWQIAPDEAEVADAPEWLLELIDPPAPPRRPPPPLRMDDMDRLAKYVAAAVDGEVNRLAGLRPGSGRNLQLFQASANLGELVAAGLLPQDTAERHLEEAASICGLLQDDGAGSVRATIASGLRRGLQNPREVRP